MYNSRPAGRMRLFDIFRADSAVSLQHTSVSNACPTPICVPLFYAAIKWSGNVFSWYSHLCILLGKRETEAVHKDWECLASSLTGKARNCVLLCKQIARPMTGYATQEHFDCKAWTLAASGHGNEQRISSWSMRLTLLGTLGTGRLTRIWGFHFSPTTSEH
jgi:hypothetical protein